ncbi:MAG: arsenite methyltransferase [Chloroflexi bacterium]|nr:arsenite methyltransferase [Chloroflexota bacterium]
MAESTMAEITLAEVTLAESAVRDRVREHYASIARQALAGKRSACCGADDVIPLEAIQVQDALPQDVVETSLGCGTPLEIARLQSGETLLDLGSGGGLDCFMAAKRVGPEGRVIGVDMTPDMLALANKNAEKVGATNVEFRKGFLEELPVADNSVDVIISNCVVNLAADKDAVFREAFRVLKPGGRVAISDMVSRLPLPEVIRASVESWAACVSGALVDEDYLAKMRKAGFVGVKKVAGGANRLEPVYSAKIVARKPGDVSRLPAGWDDMVPVANAGSCCDDAALAVRKGSCCG